MDKTHARQRGKGYFRLIAEFMLRYGFMELEPEQQVATVQTNSQTVITNKLFQSLGFKEYLRGEEPLWDEVGQIAVRSRMTRAEYMLNFGQRQATVRETEFTYFKISLVQEKMTEHDLLTWRQFFANALQQDNGILGTSIHIDILQHITDEEDEAVIVRVPRPDHQIFWQAVSGWSDRNQNLGMRVDKVAESLIAVT